jgi:hypothetical protein
MIKKFKYLTSLLALAVIGTGFLSTVEAAQISSVEITGSDSGSVIGIDKTVTVKVTAQFTADPKGSTAYVWLVSGGVATGVLPEASGTAHASNSAIRTGAAAQTPALTIAGGDFVGGQGVFSDSTGGSVANTITAGGDVSAVTMAISGTTTQTVVITATVKIPSTAGDVSGVTAAAVIHDQSRVADQPYSNIKLSAASVAVRVDANRPDQTGFNGFSGTVAAKGGVVVKQLVNTSPRTDATVLSVGDTIVVGYDLGTRADEVILDDDLDVAIRLLGKTINIPAVQKVSTFDVVIEAGQFGDLAQLSSADQVMYMYLIDSAGNLSDANPDAAAPTGVTQTVSFTVDSALPIADSVAVAASDTLTAGNVNTFAAGYAEDASVKPAWLTAKDGNALSYKFTEGLDKLKIDFTGTASVSLTLDPADKYFTQGAGAGIELNAFAKDVRGTLDLSAAKDSSYTATAGIDAISGSFTNALVNTEVTATAKLVDGTYTVGITPTDLAGNVGVTKSYADVLVDVTAPTFGARLFPIGSALDTLNAETAKVRLQLSEPVANAEVVYVPIGGAATDTTFKRVLTGSELTTLTEQEVSVDSLGDNKSYNIFVVAQDLNGAIGKSANKTFVYDKEYTNAVADAFAVTVNGAASGDSLTAGTVLQVSLQAQDTKDDTGAARSPVLNAVTYDTPGVILKITRADGSAETGVTLSGTNAGVTAVEGSPGHFSLDQNGWAQVHV